MRVRRFLTCSQMAYRLRNAKVSLLSAFCDRSASCLGVGHLPYVGFSAPAAIDTNKPWSSFEARMYILNNKLPCQCQWCGELHISHSASRAYFCRRFECWVESKCAKRYLPQVRVAWPAMVRADRWCRRRSDGVVTWI